MQPQDILNKNPKLAKRIDRANLIVKYSVLSMVVVMFILMIFVVIQLFSIQQQITASLAENKRTGAANHAKTQQYVKCIADTLLEPVAKRKPADFDKCGIEGTTQKESTSTENKSARTSSAQTAPLPNESSSTTPVRKQPTTSEPPEKSEPKPPTENEDAGLVETIISLPGKLLNGGN